MIIMFTEFCFTDVTYFTPPQPHPSPHPTPKLTHTLVAACTRELTIRRAVQKITTVYNVTNI
jgi:hypothetical protein